MADNAIATQTNTHSCWDLCFYMLISLIHDFCIVRGFDFFRIWLWWRRYNIHLWLIIVNIRHFWFRTMIISHTNHCTFARCTELPFKLKNYKTLIKKIRYDLQKSIPKIQCSKTFKLTLLVQLIVLSFQVFITRLMILVFPFHESYVFGSFFQNLSSTRLIQNIKEKEMPPYIVLIDV